MTKILLSIRQFINLNIQRKNNLNNDSLKLFEFPLNNNKQQQKKSKNLLRLIIDKINFNGRSLHSFLLKQVYFFI
jgi:hypothetical protein